jgi:predicted glycosyltransferase
VAQLAGGDVIRQLLGIAAEKRTPEQRAELARAGGYVIPEQAVDAQSLVALADVVVSAGGTMNREAVALGTPVWTTFEGRLGAVDEALIAAGRLCRLVRADEIALEKRADPAGERIRRDPEILADLLLSPVGGLAATDRPRP